MIKTFNEHNEIMRQALLIAGFETIRDTFLASLSASTDFTQEQKLAIRLAAAKLNYMGASDTSVDQLLRDILFVTWQDTGLAGDEVSALQKAQREGIIEGIMTVCRAIIFAESDRLDSLADLTTSLPSDWDAPDPEPTIQEGDPEGGAV